MKTLWRHIRNFFRRKPPREVKEIYINVGGHQVKAWEKGETVKLTTLIYITIGLVCAIAGVLACDFASRGKINVNGTIYHPIYGKYPAEVPFEQGMSLYPGQSAEVPIVMPPSSTIKIVPPEGIVGHLNGQETVGAPEVDECKDPRGCVTTWPGQPPECVQVTELTYNCRYPSPSK